MGEHKKVFHVCVVLGKLVSSYYYLVSYFDDFVHYNIKWIRLCSLLSAI